jgi:hypothetical protein
MMIDRLFFDRLNARCPRCRTRIPDIDAFQISTPEAPYTCPTCRAALIPLLSGNVVLRAIGFYIIETFTYFATIAVLVLFFFIPFFEVVIICIILIGIYGVISHVWPAVMISRSGSERAVSQTEDQEEDH